MKPRREVLRVLLFLIVLAITAAILGKLSSQDPLQISLGQRLQSPSLSHPCGTDELGRDLLSRILHGFSLTISISIMATVTSFVIGAIAGSLAGYYQGHMIDIVFNMIVTIIFSLPFLLLVCAVLSVLSRSLANTYIILTMVMWVVPARIIRARVIQIRSAQFIVMQKAMGRSDAAILFKVILPLSMPPAFTFTLGYFPEIVGLEAGLSFLGLGVQPPFPALGRTIFESLSYMGVAWWYALFPALALFIVTAASTLLYNSLTEKEMAGM